MPPAPPARRPFIPATASCPRTPSSPAPAPPPASRSSARRRTRWRSSARRRLRAGSPRPPACRWSRARFPPTRATRAIADAARRVGLPVLLKPSEGGGGIGMKAVHDAADLPAAIAQSRREAEAAFGDGTLYVERLVTRPRHVEFQILGDRYGSVVHLFERECSIQRRHQKVLEETPSTAVTPALRERMGAAAVALAKAAGYQNAGTVEFLVEGGGDGAAFYFLEMNARLQVEHPDHRSGDRRRSGAGAARGRRRRAAAVDAGGAGAVGPRHRSPRSAPRTRARTSCRRRDVLALYREPSMPGVRVDSGVVEGAEVSVHYDSLLAKLIARGETREAARLRARHALGQFPILGIRTNVPLLARLLAHPALRRRRSRHPFPRHRSRLAPARARRAVGRRARGRRGARVRAGRRTRWHRRRADPWSSLKRASCLTRSRP